MTHHQEIFTELDLTEPVGLYQNRHKMQRWRDEGDDSPWDGDKYLFDERCPKCAYDKGFIEGLEAAAVMAEDFGIASVKAQMGGDLVNLAHRQPLAKAIRKLGSAGRTEQ